MTEVAAFFYNGKTSQKEEVRIRFEASGEVRIIGLKCDLIYALSDVRIAPRIGNMPRSIYFPGGAKCETADNDLMDEVLKHHRRGAFQRLVYMLESRLRFVLLLLLLTVSVTWAFVEFVIPELAKHAAFALPVSTDKIIGEESLKTLDQLSVISPSDQDLTTRERLTRLFTSIVRQLEDGHDYRLVFRKSDQMGANAIALPSGIIVLTDELVKLAENDNELIAIMAHEIGHVIHRHALRTMLQNSTGKLLMATITGDIFSKSALSATLPNFLVQMKYSRAFEIEADRFALDYLKAHKISPQYFADILMRLERGQSLTGNTFEYLSSHPATKKRIIMFQHPKDL